MPVLKVVTIPSGRKNFFIRNKYFPLTEISVERKTSHVGGENFTWCEPKCFTGENLEDSEILKKFFPRLIGIILAIWTPPK